MTDTCSRSITMGKLMEI